MNEVIKKEILKDFQIKKFSAYGFLKNLKFFEPYLIIYLLSNNISLFEIGILIAMREIIINIFEIPSGFIADYFGRKKELYFCFGFYIISFIIFFFTNNFTLAAFGMMFFGLGEAFRSGTHKAMIYSYLDGKNWQNEKTFVYGRTRSFSLLGSALSSLLGIVFILSVPSDRYIFLFSIIPYILDLLLIMSYPKYLDTSDKKQGVSFKEMATDLFKSFKLNKNLRSILIEEGMAEASFSYVKDLIQPILELIILGSGVLIVSSLSADDNLKIILGLVYMVLHLFGSYFSKRTYLIKGARTSIECLYFVHIGFMIFCAILSVFQSNYFIVLISYVFIYILHSIRKPLFIDEVDNHIDKSNRATIISTSAQLKSLFLMIFAPIFGYIADNFGINLVMLLLCIVFLLSIPLLKFKSK